MSQYSKKKRHRALKITLLSLLAIVIVSGVIYTRFGGFGTGKSANAKELSACAENTKDINLPGNARIIALGEAAHGNVEFQELKLEVFRVMVEKYHVRAFALEGDYGGCEKVNRCIHGGTGTAKESAAEIGFDIYRTKEMADLIDYMRAYNETAAEGEDIRFYGFDMQSYFDSHQFLVEECKQLGVDTTELEKMTDGSEWSESYNKDMRKNIISGIREELANRQNAAVGVHLADVLLQNEELGELFEDRANYAIQRDVMMKDNVLWIAEHEKERGYDRIFISGHNDHIAKSGIYDVMGKLLDQELGDGYYAIGTDFYKSCCNMPKSNGKRSNQVFYSHDPIAKAAKQAGLEKCWLDFGKIPQDTELAKQIQQEMYLGSLGEEYAFYMRLFPSGYRTYRIPANMYDGMIFVPEATPIVIQNEKGN